MPNCIFPCMTSNIPYHLAHFLNTHQQHILHILHDPHPLQHPFPQQVLLFKTELSQT